MATYLARSHRKSQTQIVTQIWPPGKLWKVVVQPLWLSCVAPPKIQVQVSDNPNFCSTLWLLLKFINCLQTSPTHDCHHSSKTYFSSFWWKYYQFSRDTKQTVEKASSRHVKESFWKFLNPNTYWLPKFSQFFLVHRYIPFRGILFTKIQSVIFTWGY